MKYDSEIKSLLFGLAVGDALGVPVEFKSREYLEKNPVTNYIENSQPIGTFSDDSALSFCLVESLINGYNINDIKENMLKWYNTGNWGCHGYPYGIGNLTRIVLYDLSLDINADTEEKYLFENNGNGSLMRIAPLIFYLKDKNKDERFKIIEEVCTITHGHIISIQGCFYYIEFLLQLIGNKNAKEVYKNVQENKNFNGVYNRLLNENIWEIPKNEIKSSGYVVDTLESAIYCLTTTNNYKEAVLKAVNLGGDADTIASITGALAGLLYGFNDIPKEWIDKLLRNKDIEDLAIRFSNSLVI